MKVPEAAEIQVFAMRGDRIAQRGECIEYYDILVRGEEDEDGEIPEIEEHEDLTYEQMTQKLAELEAKYGLCSELVLSF